MINRPFWVKRIKDAWLQAPIVWLSGVRRSGKTVLAKSLEQDDVLYVNCDLPATSEIVANPELFYKDCRKPMVVFDEVHQLADPARLLKIGADVFPHIKMLATGSSTLFASNKFKDTLTGRKRVVHLLPATISELSAFDNAALSKRLYHGGLPQALLSEQKQHSFYREWLDSFFARDIQKLFALRDQDKFNSVLEYVLKQSGGLLEVTKTANALGISRPTVENHLRALELTNALTLLRPFSGGGQKEIIKMPKAYAFDTGFVSFCRGWDPLRPADMGVLWEHLVMEYFQSVPVEKLYYWRDTAGREIDFIIVRDRDNIDTIECKWNPSAFEPDSVKVFREYYSTGRNYLISPGISTPYTTEKGGLAFTVCGPEAVL